MRLSLVLILASLRAPAAAAGLPAAPAGFRPDAAARPARVERRLAAMGTVLSLSVEASSRDRALSASEAAVAAVSQTEALLSTWRPGGALARLDAAPAGEDVDVGRELVRVLERVLALSRATDGAFDPTVLPLVRAWGLRSRGRIPSPGELARALAATGAGRFRCDTARGTVRRLDAAAGIDEGAWGKGYALDLAAEALRRAGVSRATVDLGGQVSSLGPARIAIADPRERSRTAASVTIDGGSVSTSGDSERGLSAGGRRIGHLLDPRTGRPAPNFGSATVIAPSGLVADALSTALFVAGPRRGPELSRHLRHAGIDHRFLFLVVTRGGLTPIASPDLHFDSKETSR